MPTSIDLLFAAIFSLGLTWYETVHEFPKFKARAAAGVPDARRNAYRRTMIGEWAVAFAAIAIWIRAGRSWVDLGVAPHDDWRLFVGIALSAIVVAFAIHQIGAIQRAPVEKLARYETQFAFIEYLVPRTRLERRWFIALSITAGVCEELLYRGYLMWLFRAWVGTAFAAVATIVLFGAGHIYQGRGGALKATGAAVVMTGIYLVSGWLLPAILLHAMLDASAGMLGYRVMNRPAPPSVAPSA